MNVVQASINEGYAVSASTASISYETYALVENIKPSRVDLHARGRVHVHNNTQIHRRPGKVKMISITV